jgi:hypothetical protein
MNRRWRDFLTAPGTVSVLTLLALFVACMLMTACVSPAEWQETQAEIAQLREEAERGDWSPEQREQWKRRLATTEERVAAAEPVLPGWLAMMAEFGGLLAGGAIAAFLGKRMMTARRRT